MSVTTGTFPGVRIVDMPDLGAFTDTSSVVGEHAGSGRFSALAMRTYITSGDLPVVSVLDHGARGDGVSDDTAAIQGTMNTYAGKAIVFIPDTGHNYIVDALTPPSGTDLIIHGTLFLKAAAINTLIIFSGQSNVTIRGHGTLNGNGPNQVETGLGISCLAGTVTNLRVYGITVTNAHFWNVNLTGCHNVRLDGINILGPNGAANEFAAGCDDCWLLNSLVDGTQLGDYSFCFYGGCTNCGAIGNTIRHSGRGLPAFIPVGIGILSDGNVGEPQAAPCSNITIANNIIYDVAGTGISCINVATPPGGVQTGIIIANNRCYNACQTGTGGIGGAIVFVDQSVNVTITGNQMSENGTSASSQFTGIFIGPNARNVSIIGNHIYNVGKGSGVTQSAGLWFFGTPYLYVSGNHIYDDQTTPTMQFSIIGTAGPHSAIIGNFFSVPYNFGPAADTVLANVINGTWMEGGLLGADTVSVIQADSGHRAIMEYQTGFIPRWIAGTDGTAEQDYAITRVDNSGTQHVAALINRLDGSLSVHSFGLNLGDPTQTSDTAFTINAAATTNRLINIQSGGVSRWRILVNPLESGGNSGSNLEIQACRDDGSILSTALEIKRATGALTIVTPPAFASDAAAATGGVPVGGIYRNGSALQVRVV